MRIPKAISVLVFAAVLTGTSACGSTAESGTSEPTSAESSSEAPEAATGTNDAQSAAPATSGADAAPVEEAVITITGFRYVMPESIAPGALVTVVNEDDAPHTVTAKDGGGFDVDIPGGETGTFTAPGEAGEYAVICTYHPAMSGALVIG